MPSGRKSTNAIITDSVRARYSTGAMKGVLVASLVYALLENVGTIFIAPVESRALTLSVMIAFVLLRPEGIFEEGVA